MKNPMRFCDGNCNECPIVGHKNSRQLTKIFNELLAKFGEGVHTIMQKNAPI